MPTTESHEFGNWIGVAGQTIDVTPDESFLIRMCLFDFIVEMAIY